MEREEKRGGENRVEKSKPDLDNESFKLEQVATPCIRLSCCTIVTVAPATVPSLDFQVVRTLVAGEW